MWWCGTVATTVTAGGSVSAKRTAVRRATVLSASQVFWFAFGTPLVPEVKTTTAV